MPPKKPTVGTKTPAKAPTKAPAKVPAKGAAKPATKGGKTDDKKPGKNGYISYFNHRYIRNVAIIRVSIEVL